MPYIGRSTDGFGVRNRFLYLASASDTSVSGADANGATLTFTDGAYVDVYLNGVLLKAGTDYNTNTANTIAGLSALASNDEVTVIVYDVFTVGDMVSATSGGTFVGNVAMSGTLGVTGATTTAAITASGVVDITDTTDASDATGDTGALRTEGGASIAKKLYVGTDLDVDGTANLDVVDIDGAVDMASTLAIAGDTTLSRAETDGTVRLNLSNTGSNGSSEYSEIKFNSTAGSTVTSIVQHRNNFGMNIGTTTDHPVSILQNNAAALTVTTDGDIDVETNNIFFSTAGKGIFLGATSKVDANKLDDYEEGTFTPSISVASGSVTLKSGYDLMSYTKIGNLVNIRGRIETNSVSSPSGTATLTGLPFTSSNSLSERSGRSGGQVLHDTFSGLGG